MEFLGFAWERMMGSTALTGDPTALTAALLASQGVVITSTGPKQTQTRTLGAFANIGPDEPIFERGTEGCIDGKLGLLVQGSANPLANNSNEITAAAGWTFDGITAEYFATGGVGGAGYTRLTSTKANATAVRTLTRASAQRVSLVRAEGAALVGHGAPTGDELVTNGDFSSATGWTFVNASINAGALDISSGSTANVAETAISLSAGDRYLVTFDITSFTSGALVVRFTGGTLAGGIASFAGAGTVRSYMQANAGNNTLQIRANGGFVGTIDNVSVRKIAESTISTDPRGTTLPAYTGANPQLSIRLPNDGDSVKIFDFQHEEAERPYFWLPPQGATLVNVGATTVAMPTFTHPSEVDVTFLVTTPASSSSGGNHLFALSSASSFTPGLHVAWTGAQLQLKPWGGSNETLAQTALGANTTALVRIILNASTCSIQVNGGTPSTSAGRLATSGIVRGRIGTAWNADRWFRGLIYGFRDNAGTLGGVGWGHRVIECVETQLGITDTSTYSVVGYVNPEYWQ
jgi:hypothetical protein